jgi:hypothetical protein
MPVRAEATNIDPWQDIVEEAFQECQSEFKDKVRELNEEDSDLGEKEDVFDDMKNTYRKGLMNVSVQK